MKTKPFAKTILYEDDDYFIVNKPPWVATLADRGNSDDHMLLRAKKYLSAAQVCHRLDKGTSGALAFAKHPVAYKHLCEQFANQEVKKVYHAVVEGIHSFQETLIEAPISVKSSSRAVIDKKRGKYAATYLTTEAHYWKHTLVLCKPLTGKTHQIRLHLATQQAPIVGDTLYGGHPFYLSEVKKGYRISKGKEEAPLMERVALHAHKLSFTGIKGEDIEVIAPYVKDFKALISQLEKHILHANSSLKLGIRH